MVAEGATLCTEDELTRLIICVEGVPSFEFTLKCEGSQAISSLMEKLRQYYYEGAGADGIYSDERCQQKVSLDCKIAQHRLYYLSMTQAQVEQQIKKLYAPPEPPKPEEKSPLKTKVENNIPVKTNESASITAVPSPEVKKYQVQMQLEGDICSEFEEVKPEKRPLVAQEASKKQVQAQPIRKYHQETSTNPASYQKTPQNNNTPYQGNQTYPGTPYNESTTNNYNPYAQPQFQANPSYSNSNSNLQPVDVGPNKPPVVQASGDCCTLI